MNGQNCLFLSLTSIVAWVRIKSFQWWSPSHELIFRYVLLSKSVPSSKKSYIQIFKTIRRMHFKIIYVFFKFGKNQLLWYKTIKWQLITSPCFTVRLPLVSIFTLIRSVVVDAPTCVADAIKFFLHGFVYSNIVLFDLNLKIHEIFRKLMKFPKLKSREKNQVKPNDFGRNCLVHL